MGPGFPGGRHEINERLKEKKPEHLREVPGYLGRVIGKTFSRLFYIYRLVWEAKPSLLFITLFMTVYNGIMPLVGTLITANLLEQVVRSFTEQVDLVPALTLQFGYIFLNTLVSSVDNIIVKIANQIVTNHVKLKIMKKAREVDVASFDMPDFYERLENASREAGDRPVMMLNTSFDFISKLISMISYVAVLVTLLKTLDASAYIFMVLFVVLSFVSATVSFYFRRKNFVYMRHHSKMRRQLNYYSDLCVNKDMIKEIRLFGLADVFIGRYNDIFKKYFRGIKTIIRHEGIWNIVLSLLTAFMNAVLFYMIAVNVRQISDYSVYTGALNSISACVAALIPIASTIYEGSLFIDNMILFMNEKSTVVPNTPEPVSPARHCPHTIEFRNVSFTYPGGIRQVLKNINMKLEAGDTVVLVGLNGAGKTTLIKLMTRLYDPTEGQVLLDGRDIREYKVDELYRLYGIIFQDFGEYAVSAAENIAFGQADTELDGERVRASARQSGADKFIERLPDGYDTPMMKYFEENGTELSVGQWQKLSIARAFYSDSDILILDEPTASLDAIAEQEIFNQFDKLRRNKLTLFVSHRLSSATFASKIIVLRDGEIVECGDHGTLMAQRGEYYTLFSTQAKRYISNENEHVRFDNFPGGGEHMGRPPRP